TAIETGWETKMRAIPDPGLLREYMKHLSAEPHHVGSPYDRENAEWLLAKFKEWGFDAHIEEFDVLFPTPIERQVELIAPEHFVAQLKEPAISTDPTSGQAGQLPTYNAYSADGDVTAELVYVNYGMPTDYDELAKLGIDVKGKIVLARYGAGWRGVKPKVAYEHGAIGCLIYSDPRDDGYFKGDTYPVGAYRPSEGVQRGSVMDMPIHPGDPLTPGYGATKDAKRIPLDQAEVIMKIPVLPISYGDALPLLKAIGGPVAPEPWRGALPITYHIGPGPATVHLKAKFDWSLHTIRDVIAQIPGSQYPDEWVIQGNHHDAWVNGAEDPVSGLVTELEEARALGQLLKEGWRPKRTIMICAWDGEEPALLGSTEWCETHAAELAQKAVSYLNTDSSTRGWLGLEGSHSLEHFMNEVAKDVMDPKRNKSLFEALQERRLEQAKTPEDQKEVKERPDLRIAALGSGSDYSPFVQHIGVASMNTGFSGEDGGGVYHSIYDDFAWYCRFGDPEFKFERALSEFNGTAMMRLAGAEVLPFEFTDLADTCAKYLTELETLAKEQKPPEPVDFSPLKAATLVLRESAMRYHRAMERRRAAGGRGLDHIKRSAALDRALYESERKLTSEEGLPRRPWYRHLLCAPGFYTGYGVKTVPGVREALEEKRWVEVGPQMKNVSAALRAVAGQIDTATQILDGNP
ncbi:MAG TPA: transferrin receptor-like dimerization domain-containing protein, partial [Blastocatellia bacterium]|nr:transferrin receptor-like dimerization domain-containing protein [Blastocatellia bacterium]